jgi:hypothetical protein
MANFADMYGRGISPGVLQDDERLKYQRYRLQRDRGERQKRAQFGKLDERAGQAFQDLSARGLGGQPGTELSADRGGIEMGPMGQEAPQDPVQQVLTALQGDDPITTDDAVYLLMQPGVGMSLEEANQTIDEFMEQDLGLQNRAEIGNQLPPQTPGLDQSVEAGTGRAAQLQPGAEPEQAGVGGILAKSLEGTYGPGIRQSELSSFLQDIPGASSAWESAMGQFERQRDLEAGFEANRILSGVAGSFGDFLKQAGASAKGFGGAILPGQLQQIATMLSQHAAPGKEAWDTPDAAGITRVAGIANLAKDPEGQLQMLIQSQLANAGIDAMTDIGQAAAEVLTNRFHQMIAKSGLEPGFEFLPWALNQAKQAVGG